MCLGSGMTANAAMIVKNNMSALNTLNTINKNTSSETVSYTHLDVYKRQIPDIELYMDQVTTFMDSRLKNAARNPEVDKILTKTMINNYAKNDLLPPPVRKKYSREHMLLLIFIYYFKGILSISDIQTVLKPITDRFFAGNEGLKLETIYNEVFSLEREEVEVMKQDVVRKYHKAQETFSDAATEDQEFLQTFSFICICLLYTSRCV